MKMAGVVMNKIKKYVLLVTVISIFGISFFIGRQLSTLKGISKQDAKDIGDKIIAEKMDDDYMLSTSITVIDVYEFIRVFDNSDNSEAVVYIDKKDGKIVGRDVKDIAYIKE